MAGKLQPAILSPASPSSFGAVELSLAYKRPSPQERPSSAHTQKRSRLVFEMPTTSSSVTQGPLTPPSHLDPDAIKKTTLDLVTMDVVKECGHIGRLKWAPPTQPTRYTSSFSSADDIPPTKTISEHRDKAGSYFPNFPFSSPKTQTKTQAPDATPPSTPRALPLDLSPEDLLSAIPKPLTQEFLHTQCRALSRRPDRPSWSFRDSVFIKYGPRVHESEALTMLTLSGSGVPVPALYDCYRHPETGHWCILMQYVRNCQTLEQAQASGDLKSLDGGLGVPPLDRITVQLAEIVATLREVRRSRGIGSLATITTDATIGEDAVGSGRRGDGTPELGPVHDHFFNTSHILHGPFFGPLACQDFVDDLASAVQDRVMYEYQLDVVRDLASVSQPSADSGNSGNGNSSRTGGRSNAEFVLTHGELVPRHILVDSTGVRCFIDWSHAGFFPDYWEYVKAQFSEEPNCLLEEVVDFTPLSSSDRRVAREQQPSRPTKRLDVIFRPDRLAVNKAAILLMAKDIIY